MKLSTITFQGRECAAHSETFGLIPLSIVNEKLDTQWPTDIYTLIVEEKLTALTDWYRNGGKDLLGTLSSFAISYEEAHYAPLYRNPGKIFGIGLNYREHADDLGEQAPQGFPGSFFKPATALIGPDDTVHLPAISDLCDGEGELAVILGKQGRNIPEEHWLDYVAGFTVACDMTALDILAQNTRFLTLSKSFDTFFGLSHQLITPDEIEDVNKLKVRTVLNGEVFAENVVSNMTFTPSRLVSLLSQVMTWMPGDILSTGTPRGVHIHAGDVIEGQVDGFDSLKHPVVKDTAND